MVSIIYVVQYEVSLPKLHFLAAYNGNLIAHLTFPARSKGVDTFADILKLPEEATIAAFQGTSIMDILRETTDPVLQVISMPQQTKSKKIIAISLIRLSTKE